MLTYILRRTLLVLPTLIGMTLVIFLVMAWSPGGISASLISREGTMRPEERKALTDYLNKRYGLDRPLHVQYLRWINKISPVGFRTYEDTDPKVIAAVAAAKSVKGGVPATRAGDINFTRPAFKVPDLGESFIRRRPVSDLIKESLPITLLLNLISFPVIYSVAVLTGIRAARHRGKTFDVATGTIFLGLWSVPTILAGVLFIGFLASEKYLRLFPSNGLHDLLAADFPFFPRWSAGVFQRGWLLDMLWHMLLPILCLSYGSLAVLSKLSRGAVLENIAADYARTARAKGLAEDDVLYRHVFRNSLIPLITVAAHLLPAMLGGSVVVESIFGINGMGLLSVDAVFMKDPELVLSTSMIAGLLGLSGYLLSDIGYAIADPRVSYDG